METYYYYLIFSVLALLLFVYLISIKNKIIKKYGYYNFMAINALIIITFIVLFSIFIYEIVKEQEESFYLKENSYKYCKKICDENEDLCEPDHYFVYVPRKLSFTHTKDKKLSEETIKKWQELNPTFIINFYTDEDCEKYLEENFSKKHKEIFKNLKDGPVKGDYFKTHKLLEGGIFADIEYEPFDMFPLRDAKRTIIPKQNKLYNPNIILVKKNNELIKQAIKVYEELDKDRESYSNSGWRLKNILSILNKLNKEKLENILTEKIQDNSKIIINKNKKIVCLK